MSNAGPNVGVPSHRRSRAANREPVVIPTSKVVRRPPRFVDVVNPVKDVDRRTIGSALRHGPSIRPVNLPWYLVRGTRVEANVNSQERVDFMGAAASRARRRNVNNVPINQCFLYFVYQVLKLSVGECERRPWRPTSCRCLAGVG